MNVDGTDSAVARHWRLCSANSYVASDSNSRYVSSIDSYGGVYNGGGAANASGGALCPACTIG